MIFKSAAASQTASVAGFVLVTAAAVGLPQVDGANEWLTGVKTSLKTTIDGAVRQTEEASQPAALENVAALPAPSVEEPAVPLADPQPDQALPITGPVIDLLRVEPDGNTLVSGSAQAGAKVMLKSGDETIGETTADASGNFVILPDDFLSTGDYQLRVTSEAPADAAEQVEAVGQQTAVIAIPEKGKENELLAVLTTNEGPSLILEKPQVEEAKPAPVADVEAPQVEMAQPEAPAQVAIAEPLQDAAANEPQQEPAVAEATSEPTAEQPEMPSAVSTTAARIEAIETEAKRMFVAGAAQKGAKLRLYLDDRFLGATTGGDGDRFLFERSIAIEPGNYRLRIDQLGADGSVVSRAQVPFTREDDRQLQASLVQPSPVEAGTEVEDQAAEAPAARVEIDGPAALDGVGDQQIETATNESSQPEAAVPTTAFEVTDTKDQSVIIRRGDTLWRISRRVYGQGIRYTTIFLANRDQIQDPNRIFPGQIFGLPEDDAEADSEGPAATDDS